MNSPSPWLRPLQVLAVILALAILVLLVMWLQLEPTPPQDSASEHATRNDKTQDAKLAGHRDGEAQPGSRNPAGAAAPAEAAATQDQTAVLFGAVRRATGELIRRGVFWIYRDGTHIATHSLRDGTYAFANLQPGEYRLRSRIDDERPLNRKIVVRAPSTRADIDLPKRWLLTVNVETPDGQPLLQEVSKQMRFRGRSITAYAFLEPLPGDLPPSNRAEVEAGIGPFRRSDPFRGGVEKAMPKQTLGILTLPPDQPVHVALMMRNHIVAQLPATPGQDAVTFKLAVDAFLRHTATVRVRILDNAGTPLAGVHVALNDAQTGGGGVKTGDDGRALLQHLVPGRLDFEVMHKLRAPPVQVDVAAGAELDLGDVVLLQPTRVELALDNFGEGRGGVRFHWLDAPSDRTVDERYVSVENGRSRTLSLYPGRYVLAASAPNGVAILEADLRTTPGAPIRFELTPGAPLRIDNRAGATMITLQLHTQSGLLVRRREYTGTSVRTLKLPPGDYAATITDCAGAVTRQRITLTRGGTTLILR